MNTEAVKTDVVQHSRAIEQLVVGHATSDGAGYIVIRIFDEQLNGCRLMLGDIFL